MDVKENGTNQAQDCPETGAGEALRVSCSNSTTTGVEVLQGPFTGKYENWPEAKRLCVLALDLAESELLTVTAMLVATIDVRALVDRSERLKRVEQQLADMTAERDKFKSLAATAKPVIDEAKAGLETANGLVDALTRARWVDQETIDGLRGEVAAVEALLAKCKPSVRLANDWATWTDASLYAYADAILRKVLPTGDARDAIVDALAEIRKVARDRLGDDGFTIPPAYSDEQREAAQFALFSYGLSGIRADYRCELVDTVAQALGMRRAGK